MTENGLVCEGENVTRQEAGVEAVTVGTPIEDLDLFDLRNWLTVVTKEDVAQVFLNLMKGSRNDLRASESPALEQFPPLVLDERF